MVVLDEKQMLPPPPPYDGAPGPEPLSPPPFPASTPRARATLATLPPYILLHIVHQTLPQTDGAGVNGGGGGLGVYGGVDGTVARQRKVLYWMALALRLVSRALYVACMHVLRSTYLPAYSSMVRAPYSSDPFPLTSASASSSPSSPYTYTYTPPARLASPVHGVQRETAVLDQFIAVKVREDVWADDSELHVEREELFRDLFDLMQPRARLEDLVRAYALDAGVLSVGSGAAAVVVAVSTTCDSVCEAPPPPPAPPPSFSLSRAPPYASSFPLTTLSAPPSRSAAAARPAVRKLPFSALSCAFSPRSAGLIHTTRTGRRTIVEVARSRDEKLEVAAKRLVRGLVAWVEENYRA